MNQNTKRRWLAALLGAAAGMMVFFLLYGTSTLHPTYDAWILNGYDEWDIQQHYAGWVLFRNSHWAFPLGLADTIAAPDGTVISFTDSIPWVSIFFKALRGGLPSTFQWFGWYTLFCFAMQGAAGALLCARGQAKTGVGALVFSTLGGLLFVMLPTLWERAFRHTALASQWLFLLALYAFLEYRQNLHSGTAKFPWAMPVLAFLAVGIHPYFLPLVMMCALLAAVELGRQKKAWGRAALQFAASLAAAVVGGVLCGAIGSGTGASRSGYGDYSMNLNALINPTSRGGYTWSRLYQVMPQQPGQYDGFNYLGLGVLALITAALLAVGWAGTCLLEWNNPETLGGMTVGEKLLNGFFQSATLRTAGFAAIDQAKLTESGKAFSSVLMTIWARARGKSTVCAFKRTIPDEQTQNAMIIAFIVLALAVFGGIFISATSPMGFTDAVYEAVSALATVGLSAGGTASLSIPAQILIIIYMYFGRVGVLTISLGFLAGNRAEERFRYAETNLLIG